MDETDNRQTVKTTTQARSAETGMSILALLTVSTGLAGIVMGVLWFTFFRTRSRANSIV